VLLRGVSESWTDLSPRKKLQAGKTPRKSKNKFRRFWVAIGDHGSTSPHPSGARMRFTEMELCALTPLSHWPIRRAVQLPSGAEIIRVSDFTPDFSWFSDDVGRAIAETAYWIRYCYVARFGRGRSGECPRNRLGHADCQSVDCARWRPVAGHHCRACSGGIFSSHGRAQSSVLLYPLG